MTVTGRKGKKKTGNKTRKKAVKPDMLMSEDMEQTLLSEHTHKHGKPANQAEFYHKKVSPHPHKK